MIKTISSENIPIKLWLDNIEPGALSQARNLANFKPAYKHIAIMPDAHQGYGMPIGGVMATRGVIIPNAVGVDIGCGMCAVKTSMKNITRESLKLILGGSRRESGSHEGIRDLIPVGFKHHKRQQDKKLMPDLSPIKEITKSIIKQEYSSALKQIGTLGGGNHFIEIQKGDDDHIWLMIHSGSRNLGYKVARHYNNMANEINEKRKDPVPKNWGLAYFELESRQGQAYFKEMQYCVDFALANRKLMMERVKDSITRIMGNIEFEPIINIAHNYASEEEHYNSRVIVHRKGATQAQPGQTGIIPGCQGSASYIVNGKGNPESFNSCSHGAGRKMGRKQAMRELNLAEEKKRLDNLGVLHALRSKRDLDEASGAYKDIEKVMQNQQDLIDIKVKLIPLAVVKG
jgi:tRNA-splicing ligase RtcB (3'-phosphate/5'-hydroxy nucleic acid ligase)